MKKYLLTYGSGLLLIVLCFVLFVKPEHIRLIGKFNALELLVSIVFAIVIFSTSGLQYFLLRSRHETVLEKKDIVLLPIVMNLWSFIIPFQGSLLFSTLFFKIKYKMKMATSLSINIYIYLVTIFFIGFFGLVFAATKGMLISWWSLISVMLLLNPLFISIGYKILSAFHAEKISFLSKIYLEFSHVLSNTNKLWADIRLTTIIFGLNVFRTFLCACWFYWIAYSIDVQLSFVSVIMLSLIMDAAIIIKVTPGNLGVAQIASGLFLNLSGGNPAYGVLISLCATLTTMLVVFTVGVTANIRYMRYLKVKKFKDLLYMFKHKSKEILNG